MKHMKIVLFLLFFSSYTTYAYSYAPYTNISQNKTAQSLFNKGMLNYYGYLYVQAEYDFRQALLNDPECAMCFWGLALAKKQESIELGQSFATVGFEEIHKAKHFVSIKNSFQYDVIQATLNSFSLETKVSSKNLQIQTINAFRELNKKYEKSKAWKEESLALLADAIAYYPSVSDGEDMVVSHCGRMSVNDYKQEAINLLVPALNNPSYTDHPGLLHTYIHLTERDLQDPLGLVAAKKLPEFSGNLVAHYTHMPTHIYWRRGMYGKAIQANFDAIAIDDAYFKNNGAGLNSYYYEYHYLHSHHFLTALGILTNNYNLAIKYARLTKSLMDVHRMSNLKDFRDTYFSLEHLVLARFHKWQEILDLDSPAEANELAMLFINFTRCLAYLNLQHEMQFHTLYDQIKNTKYTRKNMLDFQILVISYLEASEMGLKQASMSDLETIFLKNHVDNIEAKLAVMNPPMWFFPYQLFLSEVAASRSNKESAQKHRLLYEKMYPNSTLGVEKSGFNYNFAR